MKLLNSGELADFIKERQAKQVRSLRQARKIELALNIPDADHADAYKDYADDLGIALADKTAQSDISDPIATAIMWLCAGYGVDLLNRKIVIVGPHSGQIAKVLAASGSQVTTVEPDDDSLATQVMGGEVVVTNTHSQIITADMLRPDTVFIEITPGSADQAVFERTDLKCTSQKEGLVPLVVAAVIDELIRANL